MTRGPKFGLLAGGLALLTAVALSLAYRGPLLEVLLRSALASRNVPDAELTVESVTLSETTITGVALGAGGELNAAKVIVAYEPRGLIAGRVKAIALEGVRLRLDLRGDAPPLGNLQELAGNGGLEPKTAPALPPITIDSARIEALTPLGPVYGRIVGQVLPGEDSAIIGELQFDLEGQAGMLRGNLEAIRAPGGMINARLALADGTFALPGADLRGLRGNGTFSAKNAVPELARLDLTLGEVAIPGASFKQSRLALRLASSRLEVDVEVATQDGQFTARANADLAEFPARPSGQIRIEAEIGSQAVLWPLLALPAPSKGSAEISLTARGRLPPLAKLIGDQAGPPLQFRPDDFIGRAELRLKEFDYPGLVQGLSGEAQVEARPDPATAERILGIMEIELTAERIARAGLQARQVKVAQALSVQLEDKKAAVTSQNTGNISAEEVWHASAQMSRERLSARVTAASAAIRFGPQSGLTVTHDLTVVPSSFKLALMRQGQAPIAIRTSAKKIRARGEYSAANNYAGRIMIGEGGFTAPQFRAAAEGLNATLDLAYGEPRVLTFEIGALRHSADPPLVAPFSFRGEVRQAGNTVTFSAVGNGPDGNGEVSLRGRHDLVGAEGQAKATLAPLRFAPGAAQPETFFPALAGLRNVNGEARAEATLTWSEQGQDGTALLEIDDLSLDSAAARVEGLSLDLALDHLRPPASTPGQTLSVRRIDPGIPIEELAVRFQVLPGDTPAVAIEGADLRLAGGRFRLADVVIDSASQQLHLPIQVSNLDLAEVFALLKVEGLSGDGRLSGTLPLDVTKGVPVIAGGRMTAGGPGLLRVKSDNARQALASAGESADLLLRALENFHYKELSLTIDQPSADMAVVGLSLLGSNPDVLEGYPFRFNINLETDPRKLLSILQEAFRISDRAISQMWIFGR